MSQAYEIPRIGVMKVTAKSIVTYGQSLIDIPRTAKQRAAESNLSRGDKNGYMSDKTKRSITKILRCWINGVTEYRKSTSRAWLPKMPYFTFVTLTLSSQQNHTDKEIRRKMVFPFIQKLQRKHNVWHYLFVCEKQSNGNLHIHLLIDSYIHWTAIRALWNETQELHGYIQPFFEKYNHRNPNSTDIHKIQKVKDLQAYVIKYMTTDKKDIKLDGRLWGCSNSLRELKPYNTIIEGIANSALAQIQKSPEFTIKQEENFTLIIGPVYSFLHRYHKKFFDEVQKYYSQQIERLYKVHPDIIDQIKKQQTEEIKKEQRDLEIWKPKKKIIPQLQLNY